MRESLEAAEEALGNNLQWITDLADLPVRQGDADTLRRLAELNAAWVRLATTLHVARQAQP